MADVRANEVARLSARLEALLKEQLQEHEQMLRLMQDKRAAIRQGRHQAVADYCVQENRHVHRLGELEKCRLELVAALTRQVEPGAVEPLRLQEVAEHLAEPVRGRLLVLRQMLREAIEKAQREVAVARQATENLLRHMHGMVAAIGAASTGVRTYGDRGARPRAATAVSTFQAVA